MPTDISIIFHITNAITGITITFFSFSFSWKMLKTSLFCYCYGTLTRCQNKIDRKKKSTPNNEFINLKNDIKMNDSTIFNAVQMHAIIFDLIWLSIVCYHLWSMGSQTHFRFECYVQIVQNTISNNFMHPKYLKIRNPFNKCIVFHRLNWNCIENWIFWYW